jgi:SnoaL-like protein
MTLDTRDLIEIHMLLGLYGHVIDERDWSAIDQVFTDDFVMDASDFGYGVMRGISTFVESMQAEDNPGQRVHHTTNVVITEDSDGTVRVRSKHLGPRPGGFVFVTYHDVVRKTPNGWRLAERKVLRRGPDAIPNSD